MPPFLFYVPHLYLPCYRRSDTYKVQRTIEAKKESIFHHKNIRVNNTTANLYRGLAAVSAVAEAQSLAVLSSAGESIYQHKEAYHYVAL